MRRAGLAVVLVLLASLAPATAGCGPRATSAWVDTPSGRPGFTVECWDDETACDDEAQRDCRYGYALLSSSERVVPAGPDSRGGKRLRVVVECASDRTR